MTLATILAIQQQRVRQTLASLRDDLPAHLPVVQRADQRKSLPSTRAYINPRERCACGRGKSRGWDRCKRCREFGYRHRRPDGRA